MIIINNMEEKLSQLSQGVERVQRDAGGLLTNSQSLANQTG